MLGQMCWLIAQLMELTIKPTTLILDLDNTVLTIPHDYCTVKSDENNLIIQFRDSSLPLMDTFMTIIPALVHFEDSYILNAYEDFNNYIAIIVKDTDPTKNSLMIKIFL